MWGIVKKVILFCVFLPFLFIGSQEQSRPEGQLIQAFKKVGVEPERYVLHYGNRLHRAMSRQEIEEWTQALSRSFNIGPAERNDEFDGIKFSAEGIIEQNILVKMVVINDEPSEALNHPYLSIQLEGKGSDRENWQAARDHVTRVLLNHGITPSYHYSVQGSRPVQNEQEEYLLAEIFRLLKAEEVEAMHTDHTISISALSPLLPAGIKTRGGMMNMQAAVRMNQDAHRMVITLGTPIITIEY
jgi:TATA-box binding